MPGRALEVALSTGDIRRSFEFWSRLGFGTAATGDTWPWPYGVLTAPRLALGLHATTFASPQVMLVRPDVAGLAPLLEERGVVVSELRLGPEQFNELQFTDPSGAGIRVVEARTYSPPAQVTATLLGAFDAVSWPAADPDAVEAFWARLHTDCTPRADDWAVLRADLGGLPVAWHSPRVSPEPLLVFRHEDLQDLRGRLDALGVKAASRPLGLARTHVLIQSPEGQKVALLA